MKQFLLIWSMLYISILHAAPFALDSSEDVDPILETKKPNEILKWESYFGAPLVPNYAENNNVEIIGELPEIQKPLIADSVAKSRNLLFRIVYSEVEFKKVVAELDQCEVDSVRDRRQFNEALKNLLNTAALRLVEIERIDPDEAFDLFYLSMKENEKSMTENGNAIEQLFHYIDAYLFPNDMGFVEKFYRLYGRINNIPTVQYQLTDEGKIAVHTGVEHYRYRDAFWTCYNRRQMPGEPQQPALRPAVEKRLLASESQVRKPSGLSKEIIFSPNVTHFKGRHALAERRKAGQSFNPRKYFKLGRRNAHVNFMTGMLDKAMEFTKAGDYSMEKIAPVIEAIYSTQSPEFAMSLQYLVNAISLELMRLHELPSKEIHSIFVKVMACNDEALGVFRIFCEEKLFADHPMELENLMQLFERLKLQNVSHTIKADNTDYFGFRNHPSAWAHFSFMYCNEFGEQ
jgi:hypothetical protein